jgi:hypothetical protein
MTVHLTQSVNVCQARVVTYGDGHVCLFAVQWLTHWYRARLIVDRQVGLGFVGTFAVISDGGPCPR